MRKVIDFIWPTASRSGFLSRAADVRVTDLIYGLKGERFRYVSRPSTRKARRTKQRKRRVVAMTEPKDAVATKNFVGRHVAPEELTLLNSTKPGRWCRR